MWTLSPSLKRRVRFRSFVAAEKSASEPFLKVEGLKAEIAATGESILQGVDLTVNHGEVK